MAVALALSFAAAVHADTVHSVLDSAATFGVLGHDKLVISSSTVAPAAGGVAGDVGLAGDGADGSFLKSTVTGDLFISTNVDKVDIHPDFTLNGMLIQTVAGDAALDQAWQDAVDAGAFFAGLSTDQALGSLIDTSVTVTASDANTDGWAVFSVTAMDLKEDTLTINGTANQGVIFNIADMGKFNLSQVVVNLVGLGPADVVFNLLGNSPDAEVNKAGTDFKGIILGPDRKVTLKDSGAQFTGQVYGREVNVISGADLDTTNTAIPLPTTACLAAPVFLALAARRRRRMQ